MTPRVRDDDLPLAGPPSATIAHRGIVVRGHGVASGARRDPRFIHGTIALQLPFLRHAVPEFEAYLGGPPYSGTINLRFEGCCVELIKPDYVVHEVRWTQAFPPETFFLSRAFITVDGRLHPAFLYMPDPRTKPDHMQPTGILEVLSRYIAGLSYGDAVTLLFSPSTLRIA